MTVCLVQRYVGVRDEKNICVHMYENEIKYKYTKCKKMIKSKITGVHFTRKSNLIFPHQTFNSMCYLPFLCIYSMYI